MADKEFVPTPGLADPDLMKKSKNLRSEQRRFKKERAVQIMYLDSRLTAKPEWEPKYSKAGDAAIDLRAMIPPGSAIKVEPGMAVKIPTGVAFNMGERSNMCAMILPRSGIGHTRGLTLGNGVGLIDSGYQGQIEVSLLNRGYFDTQIIHPGDRIAQLVFLPTIVAQLEVVSEFAVKTERGDGGSATLV